MEIELYMLLLLWFALHSLEVGGFFFFFLTVDEFSREYFIILNDCSKILVCLDKALDCHFVRVIFLKTHSFFLFIFSTLNKFLSIFG